MSLPSRFATSLVVVALVGACTPATQEAPPASPRPPAPAPEKPDPDAAFAPIPYTAAQIRGASATGRTITFVIESPDKPPSRKRIRFVAADDEHATLKSETLDADGKVVGEPEMSIASWDELRHHAAYPKEITTVVDAVAETPAGSFKCRRYTVIEKTKEGDKRTIACFANDLPGPPVEMSVEIGGALVMTMSLLKNEPGG